MLNVAATVIWSAASNPTTVPVKAGFAAPKARLLFSGVTVAGALVIANTPMKLVTV